jgi:hypothetical protein
VKARWVPIARSSLSTILCGTKTVASACGRGALAVGGGALELTVGTAGTGLVPLVPSSWQDRIAMRAAATPQTFTLL